MEKLCCLIVAALLLGSCTVVDYHIGNLRLPHDKVRYEPSRRPGANGPSQGPDVGEIWISGVRVPDGYDWKRDTAVGLGASDLVLLRNGIEKFSLEVSYENLISNESDLHHLIGGHLYTEFSDRTTTMIKKDGDPVLSYPGREILRGLFPAGEKLYTLGVRRDGIGFALREDGKVIFEGDGEIFGSLMDLYYPETGALYEDQGKIYFCFRRKDSAGGGYFIVSDGVVSQVGSKYPPSGIVDMKVIDGRLRTVASSPMGYYYNEGEGNCNFNRRMVFEDGMRILKAGEGICCVCSGRMAGINQLRNYILDSSGEVLFSCEADRIPVWDGTRFAVVDRGLGGYSIVTPRCVSTYGGKVYAAYSPDSIGVVPRLMLDNQIVDLDFQGFLTGISVSPPK